ncbi:MAG TPA: hypothetical protein VF408_07580 [Sediminibacterium sp.]
MNLLPVILFLVTAAILYLFLFYRKEKNTTAVLPDTYRSILHLVYPSSFDHDFSQSGKGRNIQPSTHLL